jgi:hypothetical protein
MWTVVAIMLGVLILMPIGGVVLHLYLYRHHRAPLPKPQPHSDAAHALLLEYALFGSHEKC